MIVPYIVAETPISEEAMQKLPDRIKGWEVISHNVEVLDELGRRFESEPQPEFGSREWELGKDPDIVLMSFMYNDPAYCIGYIYDTSYERFPGNNPTIRSGRMLANKIIYDYAKRGGRIYIGRWACKANFWVNEGMGRTWK